MAHKLTRLAEGSERLRLLDVLAHEALMSGKYFRDEFLATAANRIAVQLCDTLRRLVSSDQGPIDEEEDEDAFLPDAPGQDEEINMSARADALDSTHFVEGILCALKLKARLLLCRRQCILVFPKPGDRFDINKMARNGVYDDQMVPRKRKSRGSLIEGSAQDTVEPLKLCLFPALYSRVVNHQDVDHVVEADIGRCLVDYKNFLGDQQESGTSGFQLAIKALVLV